MGENFKRAVHDRQASYHLLTKLDLLTKFKIVLEFKVDVVVATSDTPAHTSEDFVERFDRQPRSEVAGSDHCIADLLQKLLALIISLSLQHLYLLSY